jgi:hypothetical protein
VVKAFLLIVGLAIVGIGLLNAATNLQVHDGQSSGLNCGSVFHAQLDEAVHQDAVNAAARPGQPHLYEACQEEIERQRIVVGLFVAAGMAMAVAGLAIPHRRTPY